MFTVVVKSSTVLVMEASTTNKSRREEPGRMFRPGGTRHGTCERREDSCSTGAGAGALVVVVVESRFLKATEIPRLQVVLSVGNLLFTMLASWLFVDHHPDGIIVIIQESSGWLSNGKRELPCAQRSQILTFRSLGLSSLLSLLCSLLSSLLFSSHLISSAFCNSYL